MDVVCLSHKLVSENDKWFFFYINIHYLFPTLSGIESHKDEFGLRIKAFSRRFTSI